MWVLRGPVQGPICFFYCIRNHASLDVETRLFSNECLLLRGVRDVSGQILLYGYPAIIFIGVQFGIWRSVLITEKQPNLSLLMHIHSRKQHDTRRNKGQVRLALTTNNWVNFCRTNTWTLLYNACNIGGCSNVRDCSHYVGSFWFSCITLFSAINFD